MPLHPQPISTAHPAGSPPPIPAAAAWAKTLRDADRCVLCGMCLPQCPTYALRRVEGDSPRGRITLMLGLAQGRLDPANPRLQEHLDGCLGCRSCEAVCPAKVPFGALMDSVRRELRAHRPLRTRATEALFAPWRRLVLRQAAARRLFAFAARAARGLRFGSALPASTRLGRVLRHTGPSLARPAKPLPVVESGQTDVLLFTGCMDAFFTGPDAADALRLLHAFGMRVGVPDGQGCCGAIDQHLGRPESALPLRERNAAAFGNGSQRIVVLDSGCEAQLLEHAPPGWKGRVTSLTGLLAGLPEDLSLWRNDPVRVALHLPCTLRNVTRETESIRRLIGLLPGVELAAVVPPHNCCGAAGTAMLTQAETADTLGRETLQALLACRPDRIVSPNVGCSVHLRALLEASGSPVPLLAPARFLVERLRSDIAPD